MTKDADDVSLILADLDKEQAQERKVNEHAGSYFDRAPSASAMVQRSREFDDIEKQFVRERYWLKEAKTLREELGRPLRLLTLPGRNRLEVEYYRENGLLLSLEQGERLAVTAFENSPEVFGILKTMRPGFQALFLGDVIAALSEVRNPFHQALLSAFPFDIVNLDLTANLVAPREGPYGPVLRAIRECLKNQGSAANDWLFMLTFRAVIKDTDPKAVDALVKEYQENLDMHPSLKDICNERYQTVDAREFLENQPAEALGQCAAKWVIEQAHQFQWNMVQAKHIRYTRKPEGVEPYTICKLIFRFKRGVLPLHTVPGKNVPEAGWHLEDLEAVLRAQAKDVSAEVEKLPAARRQKLRADVERLVQAANAGMKAG